MSALSCHNLALRLEEAILALLSLGIRFCSLPHLPTGIPVAAQWVSNQSSRTLLVFFWVTFNSNNFHYLIRPSVAQTFVLAKIKELQRGWISLFVTKAIGISHENINWSRKYSLSVGVVGVSRTLAALAFSLLIHRPACLFLQASITVHRPVSTSDEADGTFSRYFTPEQVRQGTEWGTFLYGAKQSETLTDSVFVERERFHSAFPLRIQFVNSTPLFS